MLFVGAVLACLVKASFPYSWSWVECLLFGFIFSATDPVVSQSTTFAVCHAARMSTVKVLHKEPWWHVRQSRLNSAHVRGGLGRLKAA